MGLDMYLTGEKFLWTNYENPEKNRTEEGFRIKEISLELGYWRKHPNLHGYIVQTFADGVDECQRIELSLEDLSKILDAVKRDELPHTEGFFFGQSRSEYKDESVDTLERAIGWLKTKNEGVTKTVVYKASW